jgi:hypothetical protein
MILKRLKNLWKLSEYHLGEKAVAEKILIKDFDTLPKKLATIIEDKKPIDIFEQESYDREVA